MTDNKEQPKPPVFVKRTRNGNLTVDLDKPAPLSVSPHLKKRSRAPVTLPRINMRDVAEGQ